ncbi:MULTISPECIES: glycosyltransferase family 2 protein [Acutalibacteraceae]|uniref:glycosyltransferase family 2 protein n=1 Tax=Acutalibacteraceae TaxID=3082771 RepID=UPI001FAAFDBF|nr:MULTISPECIES: glycosyltransferase [Acutalibacteraceae]
MELSLILPVKNVEEEIVGILRFVQKQAEELNSELIVVDMGSVDRTVLQAVRQMKEMGLHGYVIQNGNSTASAALNTGIQKADGSYISFIFARRLYENFVPAFLETAKRTKADFVFGCTGREEARSAERRSLSSAILHHGGNQYLKSWILRGAAIDISAVLIRRSFLLERQIEFEEACRYGYSEEFIARCLLLSDAVVQAPVVLRRNETCELKRGKQKPAGTDIFQRVESVLRIADAVRSNCPEDAELLRLVERIRVPQAVMNAVDVLLREGNDARSVRGCLQAFGYNRLLTADRRMDPKLRRSILLWRFSPGLYRPR